MEGSVHKATRQLRPQSFFMLKIHMLDGKPTITQENSRPCVYLDHWALRRMSEDTTLGNRFISALKRHGGTLAISWLNLVEFIAVTDAQQVALAENFIEGVAPNLFFISLDPWNVIEREDAACNKKIGHGDFGDKDHLHAFIKMPRDGLNPLSTRGLFSQYPPDSRLMDGVASVFLEKINNNAGQVEKVAQTFSGASALLNLVSALESGRSGT